MLFCFLFSFFFLFLPFFCFGLFCFLQGTSPGCEFVLSEVVGILELMFPSGELAP